MNTLDLDEAAFVAALSSAELGDGPAPAGLTSAARRAGTRLRRRRAPGRRGLGVVACVGVCATAVAVTGGAAHGPRTALPLASSVSPVTSRHPHPAPTTAPVPTIRGLPYVRSMVSGAEHLRTSAPEPAKAALHAPGWSAEDAWGDDKIIYGDGDLSVLIVWRPAAGFGAKWSQGDIVGHTTIDGDQAWILSEPGELTVVGPVKAGGFLTLSGTPSVGVDQLAALAAQVHRQ